MRHIKDFFNLFASDSPKELLIVAVVFVVTFSYGAHVLSTYIDVKDDDGNVVLMTEQKVAVDTERESTMQAAPYRRVDGVLVTEGRENLYPVGVMIENLSVVRPQKGLGSASVVYEAFAEGGITRFLAIFAGAPVEEVAPVRSARPYYIEWLSEYDALYAHAGGSPEALSAIQGLGINDLDYLSRNAIYFYRSGGGAPHNLYTTGELLSRALRDRELDGKQPTFRSWQFADDHAAEERGSVTTIDIYFANSPLYISHYEYNKDTNSYKRFHGTTPHTDGNTGDQIEAKNVIVQFVPTEGYYDSGKGRISLDVHGQGTALVFRNGEVAEGTWEKKERTSRTLFYDADGNEVTLARGPVWISVLPGDRKASFGNTEDEVVYEGGERL